MIKRLAKFSSLNVAVRRSFYASVGSFKNLELDKTEGIFTIGINRPEKRNAVDHETAKELVAAFKQFEDDTEVDVAVLYGKGGNFCAGYDLSSLAASDEQTLINNQADNIAPLGPSRMFIKKPVIAAVEGYCVAGGLELSLLCDLRVADEGAIFGVFCRRFGVPLLDGGTVRLQRLIGLSRAMDMILTGRAVKAKEAQEMGLVNALTDHGTALGAAISLARDIRRFPQKCLNADRKSAYYAAYNATSIEDALKYEFENGIHIVTEESIPGARKFTEGFGKHGTFNLNRPVKPKL